jgi:translation initiation factor 2D
MRRPEVSKILRSSLIQAVKELPPGLLPITASTLYSTHILPSRPSYMDATTPVDIKHSTFKTLAHFLKASAQEGLIKTKDQKGDVVITHIFLDHPDIVAHAPFHTMAAAAKKVEAKKEREQARNSQPSEIVVTELWKGIGSSHLQNLFKAVNKR